MSTTATATPRVYFASLMDYNSGTLHGVWVDIDELTDADDIGEQIDAMLERSPEASTQWAKHHGLVAEEWRIDDYEGFGSYQVSGWENLEMLAEIGAAIAEHGDAATAYLAYTGGDWDAENFEERYRGTWTTAEEYAEQYLEDCFGWNPQDDYLHRFVDVSAVVHEMDTGGTYFADVSDGVAVFETY